METSSIEGENFAFSNDNECVISIKKNNVYFYDVKNLKLLKKIKITDKKKFVIKFLKVTANNHLVLYSETTKTFFVANLNCINNLQFKEIDLGYEGNIDVLEASDAFIIFADGSNLIVVDLKNIHNYYIEFSSKITALAISNCETFIAIGFENGSYAIHYLNNSSNSNNDAFYNIHDNPISTIFITNENKIFSQSTDGKLCLSDKKEFESIKLEGLISSIGYTNDKKFTVFTCQNNLVVLNLEKFKLKKIPFAIGTKVILSKDGKYILSYNNKKASILSGTKWKVDDFDLTQLLFILKLYQTNYKEGLEKWGSFKSIFNSFNSKEIKNKILLLLKFKSIQEYLNFDCTNIVKEYLEK